MGNDFADWREMLRRDNCDETVGRYLALRSRFSFGGLGPAGTPSSECPSTAPGFGLSATVPPSSW